MEPFAGETWLNKFSLCLKDKPKLYEAFDIEQLLVGIWKNVSERDIAWVLMIVSAGIQFITVLTKT